MFDVDPILDFDEFSSKSLHQLCRSDTGKKCSTESVKSLSELYKMAQKNGTVTRDLGLDSFPDSEFTVKSRARPSGYAAQTVLHFGGVCMPALLDSCATCSVIPYSSRLHFPG